MRPAQSVMADLAAAGLSPEQLALVIELSACVAAEARPAIDKAAENKRSYDRQYQSERRKNRTKSYDSCDQAVPPEVSPKNNQTPSLPPVSPIVISNEITPPIAEPEIALKPEHVVEVWNDLATKHGLAPVKKITPERRKKLTSFIRRHTIDDITEAIAAIPRSPFLLGQNGRGWQASFDWFLEPRNLTKLSEGTYAH
jgi:hypothetical protein